MEALHHLGVFMRRPMHQGTEGDLWPMANKEQRHSSQQLPKNQILSVNTWRSLEADPTERKPWIDCHSRGHGDCLCTSYFSCHCGWIPDKKHLKEGSVYFGSQFEKIQFIMEGRCSCGSGKRLVTLQLKSGSRERWTQLLWCLSGISAPFSPFIKSEHSAHISGGFSFSKTYQETLTDIPRSVIVLDWDDQTHDGFHDQGKCHSLGLNYHEVS